MTCQGIIVLYMYLIFSFSSSDYFICWPYFKREGMIEYFQFFRSSPSTIYVQNQKNVLYYNIFKKLFSSCFVHHHSRRLKFMFLQVLDLSLYIWLWKAVIRGCTWWTERYSNKFPPWEKCMNYITTVLFLYIHWSSSLLRVVVLTYCCFFLKFNFSLQILTFEVLI
jgi:hypothetical protein